MIEVNDTLPDIFYLEMATRLDKCKCNQCQKEKFIVIDILNKRNYKKDDKAEAKAL